MIKSFKCQETESIFDGQLSKKYEAIQKRVKIKLDMLHAAKSENDLRVPPSNHFKYLKGDLDGYCSIRINDQYRVVFEWDGTNAKSVYLDDYH